MKCNICPECKGELTWEYAPASEYQHRSCKPCNANFFIQNGKLVGNNHEARMIVIHHTPKILTYQEKVKIVAESWEGGVGTEEEWAKAILEAIGITE